MLKANIVIIFFLSLIILIDGIDEADLFDDLWKNTQLPTPKSIKKQKCTENLCIKEEIIGNNENYKQQNAKEIIIKSENCSEKEIEDIKPKIKQELKTEPLEEEQNNYLKTIIKVPKIELDQLSEEAFENEINDINEPADQNSSHANDSDEKEGYRDTEAEKRKEMKILKKFDFMKNELRQEKKYEKFSFLKLEYEIAKKLGTNRAKIYKLKKKLGQKRKRTVLNYINNDTMIELIRKFDQLRKEKIHGFKYDDKIRNKIEYEIAENLGITRDKIYEWKKQFDLLKSLPNKQKLKKIKQFEKINEEFEKKFNLKPNWKIKIKIAEKIGISLESIYRWKRKFGLITRKSKIFTDAEKLAYVERSEAMKKRNQMISKRKIAKELGIPCTTLRQWTKKFGTKPN